MSDAQIDPALEALFEQRFGSTDQPASPAGADGEVGSSPPGLPADPSVPDVAGDDLAPPAPDGLTDPEVPENLEPSSPPSELAPEGGAAAETPAPPSPTPSPEPPASFDANAMFREFLGHDLDATQGESLLRLYADLSQIAQTDPQRAALIEQVMYGDPSALTPPPAAPQAPAPPATPPVAPVVPAPQVDEWGEPVTPPTPVIPPEVQQRIDALEQFAQQEAARRDAEAAAQQQQWNAWATSEMAKGVDTFAQSAPVEYTAEQLVILKTKAERSGLFPAFYQAANGNPQEAERMLLEHIALTDPVEKQRWREAEIAAAVAERDNDARRQQLASSVAAGGVSGGGQTPIDPTQLSRSELLRAGAADMERMMSGENR